MSAEETKSILAPAQRWTFSNRTYHFWLDREVALDHYYLKRCENVFLKESLYNGSTALGSLKSLARLLRPLLNDKAIHLDDIVSKLKRIHRIVKEAYEYHKKSPQVSSDKQMSDLQTYANAKVGEVEGLFHGSSPDRALSSTEDPKKKSPASHTERSPDGRASDSERGRRQRTTPSVSATAPQLCGSKIRSMPLWMRRQEALTEYTSKGCTDLCLKQCLVTGGNAVQSLRALGPILTRVLDEGSNKNFATDVEMLKYIHPVVKLAVDVYKKSVKDSAKDSTKDSTKELPPSLLLFVEGDLNASDIRKISSFVPVTNPESGRAGTMIVETPSSVLNARRVVGRAMSSTGDPKETDKSPDSRTKRATDGNASDCERGRRRSTTPSVPEGGERGRSANDNSSPSKRAYGASSGRLPGTAKPGPSTGGSSEDAGYPKKSFAALNVHPQTTRRFTAVNARPTDLSGWQAWSGATQGQRPVGEAGTTQKRRANASPDHGSGHTSPARKAKKPPSQLPQLRP